jgi:lysyl-tRNA synthetase class 2
MSVAVKVVPQADAGAGTRPGGQQPRRPDRGTALRRRCAEVPIWYLRVIGLLDLLTAVSFTVREQVEHRMSSEFYTPFMLFAGFSSGAAVLFMAMMLRRRKRVAWLVVMLLSGGYALLSVGWMTLHAYRQHPFNWISTAITLLVLVPTAIGRREYYAKGDRTNPQMALATLGVGALLSVFVGTTLVTAAGPASATGSGTWRCA